MRASGTPRYPVAALLLTLFSFATAPASAQNLSVDRLFDSDDFSAEGLPAVRWTPDGMHFTFIEPHDDGATDLLVEDVLSGERERIIDGSTLVPPGERGPITIEGYEWSPDGTKLLIHTRSQRVWRDNTKGVYFVYDLSSGALVSLSVGFGWQQFAKFSPDSRRVGFVRDNDLFVVDLASGEETRLTTGGGEDLIHGTFDWVYEEELGLQDGWRWSPDSRRIAFWRLDQTPIKTFHMIDELPLYASPIPLRYPKAGDPNSIAHVGVVDVASGETRWMDTGDNPDVYLARMEWAASPGELLIQRMNRRQNRIDLLMADARSGESRTLFSETSESWVDVDDHLSWVDGGSRFLWTSDRDGFTHIYLYDRDGTLVRQLTEGDWDVRDVAGVSEDGWIYFTGAREGPLERHLYRVRTEGGDVERTTGEAGTHGVNLAPGARFFIDSHSRIDQPPTIALYDGGGERIRPLVRNDELTARVAETGARAPEFFSFRTSDGVDLNGWMIKPPDFDESRVYPALLYVYGGPGSQTVTDAWGGTRYLWHQLLAGRGYVVVSVDNRGTGSRGRDFRKMTYLDLGRWETHDQIEAARHVARLPFVDSNRIGIWGWSYGGYMTLLSLMQGGDLFRAGISVAPVTSWEFYDTIYTERFMRTPRENPDGYRRSAPIHRVEGLTGRLLLVHGTGDDNVHFQNSTVLIDRLQEAGKQFDLMIYPNRTHSISGGETSRHLYTMMLEWLTEQL